MHPLYFEVVKINPSSQTDLTENDIHFNLFNRPLQFAEEYHNLALFSCALYCPDVLSGPVILKYQRIWCPLLSKRTQIHMLFSVALCLSVRYVDLLVDEPVTLKKGAI